MNKINHFQNEQKKISTRPNVEPFFFKSFSNPNPFHFTFKSLLNYLIFVSQTKCQIQRQSHFPKLNKKHLILIKQFSIKMKKEHDEYHELQRQGFKMNISLIQALAIIQNFQCDFFKHFLNQNLKTYKNIKTLFANKMEKEHDGYHELQRLGFEMDISPIQDLTIIQNTSNTSNIFLAAAR